MEIILNNNLIDNRIMHEFFNKFHVNFSHLKKLKFEVRENLINNDGLHNIEKHLCDKIEMNLEVFSIDLSSTYIGAFSLYEVD